MIHLTTERGTRELPPPAAAVLLCLFGLCLLATLAYWRGLAGPFVFDDYNNIVDNPKLRVEDLSLPAVWQAMLAGDAGPLKRPLSMLSFMLNYVASGLAPFPFKLTNLGIHLLNGVLVFSLCRRLVHLVPLKVGALGNAQLDYAAVAATGFWLLHPVQLTSVLYVVQRMTSLSATFVLLGLLVYLRARLSASPGQRRRLLWLGVPCCAVLAALTKESGLLLFAFAFVIEAVVFRYARLPGERWGTPAQFFALTVALPLSLLCLYLLLHPEWFQHAAANRSFTVVERLWTESRVLFLYLSLLFVPAISNMALFYDDFVVSRGFFDPMTTALAIAAWTVLLGVSFILRRQAPWLIFSVLWYFAGHAMESTIVNLELVHPHRNYLAFVGPLLGLSVTGAALLGLTRPYLAAALTVVVTAALATTTSLRADQWRNPLDLAAYEVIHRPESPRANYEIARLLNLTAISTGNESLNKDAIRYLRKAAELEPTEISALVGIAVASESAIPADVLSEIQRRLRASPMGLNQVSYLRSLIECLRVKRCKTPPEQVHAIFGALLGQPALRPRVKADAVTMLGIYYLQELNDIQAGVRMMQEATQLQPEDVARYINLAQALMFAPDVPAADAALTRASSLDALGAHRDRIAALRIDLAKIAAGASRTSVEMREEGANSGAAIPPSRSAAQ